MCGFGIIPRTRRTPRGAEVARRAPTGMTLVELVIVMAVIMLVLGAVIPTVRSMQIEGQLTAAQSELGTLKAAITSFWRHNEYSYPASLAILAAAMPLVITSDIKDPFNTSNGTYGYLRDGASEYFIIWTHGPKKDTVPVVANGKVTYSGSGFVMSNFPVERQ